MKYGDKKLTVGSQDALLVKDWADRIVNFHRFKQVAGESVRSSHGNWQHFKHGPVAGYDPPSTMLQEEFLRYIPYIMQDSGCNPPHPLELLLSSCQPHLICHTKLAQAQ
jgi:hypothetical protein